MSITQPPPLAPLAMASATHSQLGRESGVGPTVGWTSDRPNSSPSQILSVERNHDAADSANSQSRLFKDGISTIYSYLSFTDLLSACRMNHHWYEQACTGPSLGFSLSIRDADELMQLKSFSSLSHHIQELEVRDEDEDEPAFIHALDLNRLLTRFTALTELNVHILQEPMSLSTWIQFPSEHAVSLTSVTLKLGTSSTTYIQSTLESLSRLSHLITLSLDAHGRTWEAHDKPVTEFTFSPLIQLTRLRTLKFFFNDVSIRYHSSTWHSIRELSQLTSLNLNDGQLTTEQILELRMPNLTEFNQDNLIIRSKQLCDELSDIMPGLKSLTIYPVTKTSLGLLPRYPHLESVRFDLHLAPRGMPIEIITDQTLIDVIVQCQHLTHLTFGTSAIQSPQSWIPIFATLPQLTSLAFVGTKPNSFSPPSYDNALTSIALVSQHIQVLHLQSCFCPRGSLLTLSGFTGCRELYLLSAFDPNDISFQQLKDHFNHSTILPSLTHLFISCDSTNEDEKDASDGDDEFEWGGDRNLNVSTYRLQHQIQDQQLDELQNEGKDESEPPTATSSASTTPVEGDAEPTPVPLCYRCDSFQVAKLSFATVPLPHIPLVDRCGRCTNNYKQPDWIEYDPCLGDAPGACTCQVELTKLKSLVSDPAWNIWYRCFKEDTTARILVYKRKWACSEMRTERALNANGYPNRTAAAILVRAGMGEFNRPSWANFIADLFNLVTNYFTVGHLVPLLSVCKGWYSFFQMRLKEAKEMNTFVADSDRLHMPLQSERTFQLVLTDSTHLMTSPLSHRVHRVHLVHHFDQLSHPHPWLINSGVWFADSIRHVTTLTITFKLEFFFLLHALCPLQLYELNLITEYDVSMKSPQSPYGSSLDHLLWFRERIVDWKKLTRLREFKLQLIELSDDGREEVALPMRVLEQVCQIFPQLTDLSINVLSDERCFEVLKTMTNLKRLSLGHLFRWSYEEVTRWLSPQSNQFDQLEFIDLSNCELDYVQMSSVRLKLREFAPSLFGAMHPPAFLPFAYTLTNLRLKCTSDVDINDLVVSLESCHQMVRLGLAHPELTSNHLVTSLSRMVHLQVLHLSDCYSLGGLGFLSQVGHLSETLNCLILTSSGIQVNELDHIFSLTHLYYLVLSYTLEVGEELTEDVQHSLLPGAKNSINEKLHLPALVETRIDDLIYEQQFLKFVFETSRPSLPPDSRPFLIKIIKTLKMKLHHGLPSSTPPPSSAPRIEERKSDELEASIAPSSSPPSSSPMTRVSESTTSLPLPGCLQQVDESTLQAKLSRSLLERASKGGVDGHGWANLRDLLLVADHLSIKLAALVPLLLVCKSWYRLFKIDETIFTEPIDIDEETHKLKIPLPISVGKHIVDTKTLGQMVTSPLSRRVHCVEVSRLDNDKANTFIWLNQALPHLKLLHINLFASELNRNVNFPIHLCSLNLSLAFFRSNDRTIPTVAEQELSVLFPLNLTLEPLKELRSLTLPLVQVFDGKPYRYEPIKMNRFIWKELTNFKQLTELYVDLPPQEFFFRILRKMTHLKRLSLGRQFPWNNHQPLEWLIADPNPLGKLEFIDLSNTTMIDMHSLLSRISFKELSPDQFNLMDPGPLLLPLSSSLTYLRCQCTNEVNLDCLVAALQPCHHLVQFRLSHHELTSDHLERILSDMNQLQVLHLFDCYSLGSLKFLTDVVHLSHTLNWFVLASSHVHPHELIHILALTELAYLNISNSFPVDAPLTQSQLEWLQSHFQVGSINPDTNSLFLPHLRDSCISNANDDLFDSVIYTSSLYNAQLALMTRQHLDTTNYR